MSRRLRDQADEDRTGDGLDRDRRKANADRLEPAAAGERGRYPGLGKLLGRRSGRFSATAAALAVIAAAVIVPLATRKPTSPKPPKVLPNSLVKIDPKTGGLRQVVPLRTTLDGSQLTVVPGGDVWVVDGAAKRLLIADPSIGQVKIYGGDLFGNGIAADATTGSVWVTGQVSGTARTISRLDPTLWAVSHTPERTITVLRGEPGCEGVTNEYISIQCPGRHLDRPIDPGGHTENVSAAFIAGHERHLPMLVAVNDQMTWPNGDGMVWISVHDLRRAVGIDARTGEVMRVAKTGPWSDGIALGAGSVWVSNYADGTVSRIDAPTGRSQDTISGVGLGPADIAVGFGSVWVSDPGAGSVARIDPGDDSVHPITGVGAASQEVASAIAFGPTTVWVASPSGWLVEIDPATNEIVDRIRLPYVPAAMIYADGNVWVTVLGLRSPPA